MAFSIATYEQYYNYWYGEHIECAAGQGWTEDIKNICVYAPNYEETQTLVNGVIAYKSYQPFNYSSMEQNPYTFSYRTNYSGDPLKFLNSNQIEWSNDEVEDKEGNTFYIVGQALQAIGRTSGSLIALEEMDIPVFSSKYDCERYLAGYSVTPINPQVFGETGVDWLCYLSNEKQPFVDMTWKDKVEDLTTIERQKVYISIVRARLEIGTWIAFGTPIQVAVVNYSDGSFGLDFAQYAKMIPTVALLGSLVTTLACTVYSDYLDNEGNVNTTTKFEFTIYRGSWLGEKNSINNPFSERTESDGSTFIFKMGYKEEDETYIEPTEPDTPTEPDVYYSSNGIGNKQYALTTQDINSLTSFLWSGNLLDSLQLVNNNPIENIISIKMFPFEITSGATTPIYIGNVQTNVSAVPIPSSYSAVKTFATFMVPHKFNNFLDFEPYTSMNLYLPFIGIKEIQPSIVVGRTIKIDYVIDIITGACKALVYVNSILTYEYSGTMGIDLPLTSSNRAQLEVGYVQSAIGTVANVASGNYLGALNTAVTGAFQQFHTETSGQFAPNTEGYSPRSIYLIASYPTYQDIDTFNHTHGRKCNLSLTLGNLQGYTICADGVDLSGLNCLEEEKEQLRDLLTSGFYL